MESNLSSTSVGQLVTERPRCVYVLERYGIDYCCDGKRTLKDACAAKTLDLDEVLNELRAVDDGPEDVDQISWSRRPMSELVEHILHTHHAYLRDELPRLQKLLEKVLAVHRNRHPELEKLCEVFSSFHGEIYRHMAKEEQILFPMICRMQSSAGPVAAHCGGIDGPIRQMEFEHEDAGGALARMRELTDGFAPPLDACDSYRTLFKALADLEADMHVHIHKENSILFPRASAAEAMAQ